MVATAPSPYTNEQITAWLRGLLTIAWADGHLDTEEQDIINVLIHELAPTTDASQPLEPILPADLAAALGQEPATASNFIRMGVMVALADSVYSFCEDEVLYQFCQALNQDVHILDILRRALHPQAAANPDTPAQTLLTQEYHIHPGQPPVNPLQPVRDWLDSMDVHDPRLARLLCRMIPAQCPFERDINLMGHKVLHIPPLCKINPLYEQLVGLRFRALSYLADDCKEDVSPYC